MARKKSSFYHVRCNKVGINEDVAARILSVTRDEIEEFDKNGAPEMAESLLLLWDRKHVNVQGWDGWVFSRGVLKYKKEQWRPDNILSDRRFRNSLEIETQLMIARART